MSRLSCAASAALLVVALAGCNQTAAPVVPLPPPEGGCGTYIPQFRAQLDSDGAAGKFDRGTYSRAISDITQAETACSAGREQQARLIYLSTRHTYGYPQPGSI